MPSTERYAPFRLMIGLFCLIIGLFNAETMHYTLQSTTAVNSRIGLALVGLFCLIIGLFNAETMHYTLQSIITAVNSILLL